LHRLGVVHEALSEDMLGIRRNAEIRNGREKQVAANRETLVGSVGNRPNSEARIG